MTDEEIMSMVFDLTPAEAKRAIDDIGATITEYGGLTLDQFTGIINIRRARSWTENFNRGDDR